MERLTPDALRVYLANGGRIVDIREPPVFADAHVRGSLNLALSNRSAPYWLHELVGAEERVAVVSATDRDAEYAAQLFDAAERTVVGFLAFDGPAFERVGIPIGSFRTITPDELAQERDRLTVVDVREAQEWVAGHVPGALWIPLPELAARASEIPSGAVALVCASGFRSATGASILEAAGRGELANVWGGTMAWMQLGLPVNRGRPP